VFLFHRCSLPHSYSMTYFAPRTMLFHDISRAAYHADAHL
jgi:hypothetical protein